jgi:hypothetical protein
MKEVDVIEVQEVRRRADGETVVEAVKGWGVRFANGRVYVQWNRDSCGENRLDHEHVSEYGSLEDVETATSFTVEIVHSVLVGTGSNSGAGGT